MNRLLTPFGLIRAILRISARRLWTNRRLALGMLVGFTAAVAAASSVPAFTAGALQRVLQTELAAGTLRQPAAVHVAHFENPRRPTKPAMFEQADDLARTEGLELIGLPVSPMVRYGAMEKVPVTPFDPKRMNPNVERFMSLTFLSDLEQHVKVTDGRLPKGMVGPDHFEVMVDEEALDKQDFTVGAELWVPLSRSTGAPKVKVTVVGSFERLNPEDPYWFLGGIYEQALFLPEASFRKDLITRDRAVPAQYSWYYGLQNTDIQVTDVIRLLGALYELEARMVQVIPDTELFGGPMDLLTRYALRAMDLQLLLLLLVVPPLVVVGYFLVVTSGLMVDGQRQEIASLRSRGASLWQIASIYLLEGALLGGLASVLGFPLGALFARAMGAVSGFLQFVDRKQPPLILPLDFWLYGFAAAALAALAYLLPAIPAARESIVTFKQESARRLRRPFWNRIGLDFIALAVAGYAFYTLYQRHQALLAAAVTADSGAPVRLMEPIHVLAPALFVLGAGLLLLRLFPLAARLGAFVADRKAGAPLYLALAQLSRATASYTPVILLLTLTVGMGLYSASAARTLERNTADRVLYAGGADVVLEEIWEYKEVAGDGGQSEAGGPVQSELSAAPPWEGHYTLPGVVHPARVRTQSVVPMLGGRSQRKSALMAIDPQDFGRAIWFRRDLNDFHINEYLNLLAQDEEAVLVNEDFLRRNKLKAGDRVTLVGENQQEVSLVIYGTVQYWPALYPEQGDFFVANLDYVEQGLGLLPYQVWLKMAPGAKLQPVIDALKEQLILTTRADDYRQKLIQARRDPQLNGLLGGLTNGFLLSAVVSILGFWLHAALNVRARVLQFGVLRAMGLSKAQLLGAVALEQVLVVGAGVACGTGLGVAAASLFVPFLQQGAGSVAVTPPFVVVSLADDRLRLYIVLVVMLVAGIGGLMAALGRLRIHEAVKLGEDH